MPLAVVLALTLAFLPPPAPGDNLRTESRSPHLHRIPLRDADGQFIPPPAALNEQGTSQEVRANPYSPAQTCGRCHEYEMIGGGWHFNSAKASVNPGRPGEPWILTDTATHTQLPLSYRGWPGTFKPSEIGLTDFDFVTTFARHLPGGGVGEPAKGKIDAKDARMRRLLVTGTMEIDCLICHEMSGHYDHVARFRAMNVENIRWAPSVGAGLGTLGAGRTAKSIADFWKPAGPPPANLPMLKYDRTKLDAENHVTFDVTRKPSANNCYYCHTSDSQIGDARWHSDRDVHIRGGMSCVECHRNGVDHMVVRGYEGETKDRQVSAAMVELRAKLILRDDATISEADARGCAEQQLKDEMSLAETFSCRGCHYGSDAAKDTAAQLGGRLGAPKPLHKGLPPVHLEKLACTACHSGPFPTNAPQIVHTSRAHKLGLPAPVRTANTPPVIVQPVFLRGQDGRIAPHKMVWPSYWGQLKAGKVTPMLPAEVSRKAKEDLPSQSPEEVARDPYYTKPLTNRQIRDVLGALSGDSPNGQPVFVAAGRLFRLVNGKLASEEHDAARPYAWALAHDVRPASQALGARGCSDCHSDDSPVYFAKVTSRGPVESKNRTAREMWAFRGDDRTLASIFAFTFKFRPMLKYIGFASALIVLGVLLSYGFAGLHTWLGHHKHQQDKP
ncbi:MAG: hypothetical protein HZA91_15545 [Verrucomicrobia bacterium]|nr:hypothetical protein [Verrucomicrobiota bacterium]